MTTRAITPLIKTLKEARIQKNLSQTALAKKLNIPQSHLSKIERGKVNPTLESTIELARTVDLELVLVPVKFLAMVKALVEGSVSHLAQKPAYTIEAEDDNDVL